MRQEGLRAVHHAPEVDVHDAVDVLELHVLDLAVVGDSGIVEDRVDPAEMIGDGLRVLEHRFAFGDVEQLAVHLRAGRLDEPLGLGETVGVDVADGDLGAALAERMKAVEDLQHRVQVERETALLAWRLYRETMVGRVWTAMWLLMAGGMPFGPTIPAQVTISRYGAPACATVGTLGSSGERV